MNGYQRVKAALSGDWPDSTPVMLHNFMMAAREAGFTMDQFRNDPQAIADSFIQAVEKYHYDGAMLDVDTVTLAEAVGVPIDFPRDQPARCHGAKLKELCEVDHLEPVDIKACRRVQVWLEAARLLVRHFDKEVFVRGNCDQCPFSLASMMRSPEQWMLDLTEGGSLEKVQSLLNYCLDITVQFIRLMAQTGVHMLSNGDSPAGPDMISPRMYRQFALPSEQKVVQFAHGLHLPYVLHICGKTDRILEDMVSTGSDGLELDYKTDLELAEETLRGKTTFIGNLDPNAVLALGTTQLVETETHKLLECFRHNPRFILNAGCAIPAITPTENLQAMIRVARQFSRS